MCEPLRSGIRESASKGTAAFRDRASISERPLGGAKPTGQFALPEWPVSAKATFASPTLNVLSWSAAAGSDRPAMGLCRRAASGGNGRVRCSRKRPSRRSCRPTPLASAKRPSPSGSTARIAGSIDWNATLGTSVETPVLFVRFWLTTTPRLLKPRRAAARASGNLGYDQVVVALGRWLSRSQKLRREIPEDIEPHHLGDESGLLNARDSASDDDGA